MLVYLYLCCFYLNALGEKGKIPADFYQILKREDTGRFLPHTKKHDITFFHVSVDFFHDLYHWKNVLFAP